MGLMLLLVFVDKLSKLAHLHSPLKMWMQQMLHGCSLILYYSSIMVYKKALITDRDPRFTNEFWNNVFEICGTRLIMSPACHPKQMNRRKDLI